MKLSAEFMARLDKFAKLAPDWDSYGADVISIVALKKAEELAERSLEFAPEPFIAPCADGEVWLRWTLPNGNHVETCAADEWDDEVALTLPDGVHERRVPNADALMALLLEAAT